jgi:DNA mismatch repair protein MutS
MQRRSKSSPQSDDTSPDLDKPASAPAVVPSGVTPSMAQFLEIKAANPDCILWYRMGDFYELFFEDAVAASAVLGIVLTKRGKHLGDDIPMCGVPIHRADEYLQRLIRKGFRVAVCEQLEDPAEARKRGAKSIVRRDVVRLVTPGTLTEDSLLEANTRNYLTAIFRAPPAQNAQPGFALASLDISTGEFEIGEISAPDLQGELARLAPGEVLAADTLLGDPVVKLTLAEATSAVTPVPSPSFDSFAGERLLKSHLGISDLAGHGAFSRGELAAVGALLKYVELTQLGRRPVVLPPRRGGSGEIMVIDAATRASLELVKSVSGDRSGSLLASIDRTVTGPGARALAERLASPSRDIALIARRLDAVGYFTGEERLREDLREALRRAPDMARSVARLAFQRGGPRDLAAIRDALTTANAAAQFLKRKSAPIGLPSEIQAIAAKLAPNGFDLQPKLANALVDEPPPFRRDGGFVRAGFSADIDMARSLREDSRKVMAALEARYVEQTSVKSLKIRHNNILGYYIEVTAGNAKPLTEAPHNETFKHRQTMASAMRFTTTELVDIEGRIASAGERALGLEQDVFNMLADEIAKHERTLGEVAASLANLDCHLGLAEIAVEQNYVRPVLGAHTDLAVIGGRHPVVEQALKSQHAGPFVENDCVLGRPPIHNDSVSMKQISKPTGFPGFDDTGDGRIWLVTGPNMAGKSTFLRQNALIVVLAQMGSFVPARSAHIGLCDRLFSRVGASDDLARGRSTFMVEMVETAGILNQATAQSLVILDEIGRGTATFDGLSIAWATVEYLHEVSKCRALFATHYHEMTALAGRLKEVSNVTIDVKEWQDEIVFLHKLKKGAADRSYGIQVAKLAGLPSAVIKRAGEVLNTLEAGDRKGKGAKSSDPAALDDLPLFASARPSGHIPGAAADAAAQSANAKLVSALAAINPDELTPKAALEALYKLKALSKPKP